MNCKFCDAPLEEGARFCTSCGGLNTIPDVDDEPECDFEEMEMDGQCAVEEVSCESPSQERRKTKHAWWKIALAVFCCAALLFCLTAVILSTAGINIFDRIGRLFKGRENNILYKDSYSVEDAVAINSANTVIATLGDMQLTNGMLQLYYTQQVYDYIQYYSSILGTLGLDYTKPLAEQPCYYNKDMTWQQYLLDKSIQTWHNYAIMNLLANEAGEGFDESEMAELSTLPQEWTTLAEQLGYESGDAFIQFNFGASANMETYLEYTMMTLLSEHYYESKYAEFLPDMEEIEKFYADNEADFISSGVSKDSGPIVDVRHILLMPASGEMAENDTVSEEDWEACLRRAEELLAQWKSGNATEESFAALATEYTEDPGSKANGGLYQAITAKSNYVPEFLNWCIDESRQIGNTGIVRTEYGYHIMYFVDGQEQWIAAAETNLVAERITQMLEDSMERWPLEVNYKKVVLASGGMFS